MGGRRSPLVSVLHETQARFATRRVKKKKREQRSQLAPTGDPGWLVAC